MIRISIFHFAACMAVILAVDSALTTKCLAERVGYSFQGALTPPHSGAQTYKLFGVIVPSNSPITGTFSYDTTTIGVDSSTVPGAKDFKQTIHGGITWNILDAAGQSTVLRLAAHEYQITVANDFSDSPPSFIDYLSVDYKFTSTTIPAPLPIWVNGAPYTGSTAELKAALSWDPTTFNDADEPKLHAELPTDSFSAYLGTVRSSSPAVFTITSLTRVTPSTGDLNLDGHVNVSDYIEWRRAFGGRAETFPYADVNADHAIDASDYVLWRKATSPNSAAAAVPEPKADTLAAIAVMFVTVCHLGRPRCSTRKSI